MLRGFSNSVYEGWNRWWFHFLQQNSLSNWTESCEDAVRHCSVLFCLQVGRSSCMHLYIELYTVQGCTRIYAWSDSWLWSIFNFILLVLVVICMDSLFSPNRLWNRLSQHYYFAPAVTTVPSLIFWCHSTNCQKRSFVDVQHLFFGKQPHDATFFYVSVTIAHWDTSSLHNIIHHYIYITFKHDNTHEHH